MQLHSISRAILMKKKRIDIISEISKGATDYCLISATFSYKENQPFPFFEHYTIPPLIFPIFVTQTDLYAEKYYALNNYLLFLFYKCKSSRHPCYRKCEVY